MGFSLKVDTCRMIFFIMERCVTLKTSREPENEPKSENFRDMSRGQGFGGLAPGAGIASALLL